MSSSLQLHSVLKPEHEELNFMSAASAAPGKIILSGEHSVVYGTPALAIAVDIYANARFQPRTDENILIEIQNEAINSGRIVKFRKNLRCIFALEKKLDQSYERYRRGEIKIGQILEQPVDLYFYALSRFFSHYALAGTGLNVKLDLQMPLSSGMGSSSASLAAFLCACASFFRVTISRENLITQVGFAERLQHGCISQIDPVVSVYGGMVRVESSQFHRSENIPAGKWYLVNTGIPEVSTGQCVAEVKRRFAKSRIWEEFSTIVRGFEQALLCADGRALKNYVRRNHELLVDIGVVPATVQNFIRDLKRDYNAAGKITGAGAVSGEKAGFLLVRSEHSIKLLCEKFRFSFHQLQPDLLGACLR